MGIISRIKSTIGKTYAATGGILDRVRRGNIIEVANTQAAPKSPYSDDDLEELAGTVYGEASSINVPDLEPEARAMISSVLNRSKVIGKPIKDVLAIPNQFLAYGGPQYQKFKRRDTTEVGAEQKMKMIDDLIQQLKDGTFVPEDFTSFNQDPKSGGRKIGSHYFFKEDKFRTK